MTPVGLFSTQTLIVDNVTCSATIAGLLNKQQKQDLHECFSMLDADQKGRVSVDNLLAAFHVLEVEVQLAVRVAQFVAHCQLSISERPF